MRGIGPVSQRLAASWQSKMPDPRGNAYGLGHRELEVEDTLEESVKTRSKVSKAEEVVSPRQKLLPVTPAIVEKEPGSPAQVQSPEDEKIKEAPGDDAVDEKEAKEVRSRRPGDPKVMKIIDERSSPQFESLLDRFDSLLEKLDQLLERQPEELGTSSTISVLEDLLVSARDRYRLVSGLQRVGQSGMHRHLTQLAVQLSAAAKLLGESYDVSQAGQTSRNTLLSLTDTGLISYRNTLVEPLLRNSIDLVI
jgi:hypothetical protein